ncbi:MAG: sulfatase [Hyphomonadaceae bacterium]
MRITANICTRAALLTAFCLLQSCSPLAPPTAKGPQSQAHKNIVFVLLDDLRFDAMGFLTPGLDTPNIDFLAKHGVYFPNAVVTTSLCSPSRATILTGRTTANHGIVDNNNSSEEGLTFFPTYLQQAGYQTGFFGKWHMGNSTDAPRPGFNKWVSFKGQGTYFPTDALTPAQKAKGEVQMLNVDGRQVPRSGYVTDELTDYALTWLKQERDPSKPFFLYLSHKAVHSDPLPSAKYADQYRDLDIKLPASMANTEANNRGKPMWVRNQRNSWHGVDFPYHSDQDLREYVRQYYRTLSPVDESLGRILGYLREANLDKNTLIVFYSDNGFLFGDHGLIDKRNAYEPSVRVPLVMYAPGLLPEGVTNTTRVRNLDMAPTFLAAADVAVPVQFEGRSFLDTASGAVTPAAWNAPDFVYSYYWEWTFPHTPTTFAIEAGTTKYIQYHGVWDIEELYDLSKDPDELNNLIDDPKWFATKVDLRARLYAGLANENGQHIVPYGQRNAEGIVWRNPDGARAADFPAKWLKAPNRPDKLFGAFPQQAPKPSGD